MSTESEYVFNEKNADRELIRLRQIEKILDPTTVDWLKPTGIGPGWSSLEIGPGAGSIADWLLKQSAPTGQVTTVDLNPIYVKEKEGDRFRVVTGDFRSQKFPEKSFDLIHARYVLIHVKDYADALKNLVRLLKPGGWIVIEEPDFKQARFFEGKKVESARKVAASIVTMFEKKELDPSAGTKLKDLFLKQNLEKVFVENDAPIAPGASPMANMMSMSADTLRAEYKTGGAKDADIEGFLTFAADLNSSAIYYATVRARGQAPLK